MEKVEMIRYVYPLVDEHGQRYWGSCTVLADREPPRLPEIRAVERFEVSVKRRPGR